MAGDGQGGECCAHTSAVNGRAPRQHCPAMHSNSHQCAATNEPPSKPHLQAEQRNLLRHGGVGARAGLLRLLGRRRRRRRQLRPLLRQVHGLLPGPLLGLQLQLQRSQLGRRVVGGGRLARARAVLQGGSVKGASGTRQAKDLLP